MTTTLSVDLFISADGFAGSDGLPGYFGYLGPDLEAWIADSAAPTVSIMGRRTYESLPEWFRPLPDRRNATVAVAGYGGKPPPNARLTPPDPGGLMASMLATISLARPEGTVAP